MRIGAELEWPLTVVVSECLGRVSGRPVGQNQHLTHRQGPHFLIQPSIWSLSESDPSFNQIHSRSTAKKSLAVFYLCSGLPTVGQLSTSRAPELMGPNPNQ